MKKSYTILSFMFGDYDLCREPMIVDPNCDYVFITDNKCIKSNTWRVIYTEQFKKKSPVYASFYVRYHPWEYVNTDVVIIIDASIQLKNLPTSLLNTFNKSKYDALFTVCSYFNGSISEGIAHWKHKPYKFDKSSIDRFLLFSNHFKMSNYKGILEATLRIIRRTQSILDINEETWEICKFLKGADDIFRVDQYVFTILFYAEYLSKIHSLITGRNIMQSDFFQYCEHNTEKPIIAKGDHSTFYFNNMLIHNMLKVN